MYLYYGVTELVVLGAITVRPRPTTWYLALRGASTAHANPSSQWTRPFPAPRFARLSSGPCTNNTAFSAVVECLLFHWVPIGERSSLTATCTSPIPLVTPGPRFSALALAS